MIVPKFWAEATARSRENKRSITVRRFGWSNSSQEDAQRNADDRVQDALTRIRRGEKLGRLEHKIAYNGAEGLPIREEIVGNHGETVITRNSYGALCLNTPNVLFADIDFEYLFRPRFFAARAIASLLLAAIVGGMLHSIPAAIGVGLMALALLSGAARVISRLIVQLGGGAKKVALKNVYRFSASHPEWRFAIYETPGGLRLLALHRTFEPREPVVTDFFTSIQADSLYARMCANQNCFRARLSPKPWRIGIGGHMKPRPGVWPIKQERMAERQQWIDAYERTAQNYAACRFLEFVGSDTVDSEANAVRELHDELSRSRSDLKIA